MPHSQILALVSRLQPCLRLGRVRQSPLN
jgi:hypothetical protein